jgi:hypothetical protein
MVLRGVLVYVDRILLGSLQGMILGSPQGMLHGTLNIGSIEELRDSSP